MPTTGPTTTTRTAILSGGPPARGDRWAFARGWWRAPTAVGGPFRSSVWTADRIARAVLETARGGGPVVETGAGTGPITEALLRQGCPLDGLVVIERDPAMCDFLAERIPGLRIVTGDAIDLRGTLAAAGVRGARAVLSGLPMRVVAADAARRYYESAFELMPPGGAVTQYTYGVRSPLDPAIVDGAGLEAEFVGREWRNLPPMGVWRYRRR